MSTPVDPDSRNGDGASAPQPGMVPTRPTMQGVPIGQPAPQGGMAHAQPMQHVQHLPVGHMTSPGMMQPQAGQPTQQNHMIQNAHHIVSQYQASNPNAQHVQAARPHMQSPTLGMAGSGTVANQARPRPVAGQAQPVTQAQPIAQAQPMVQAQPIAKAQPVAQAQPIAQAQPVTQAQPVAHSAQPATAPVRPAAAVRPSAPAQAQQTPQNSPDLSRVFKAKLFALAKEDSEVHDLWYAKGRKIKEENPDLNQREWFQRIVKAVFDEVRVNKKLYQKIWTYNENAPQKAANSVRPQAPVGQAQSPGAQAPSAGAHSAVGQVQHATMQQAQPLVPVGPVAPGQPRPVVGTAVPLGAAVGQTAQPRPQAVRPGQAMSLQPVVGAQQYPGAYATAAVGQRPAYPYPQYMQPGMVRPSHPLAPQFTEAQRKKAEEERQAKDEQKRREIEEKRQRIQEENARKAQQKREREEAQRQKKQQLQAERDRKAEIRREDKRRKDEEKLRKKEERERQRLERQSKGRKRPVANKNAGSGGSMVPLPADDGQVAAPGSVQGKKRPPARKAGAARKKPKTDDQPVGVAIDMDDEEAALLGAMLKMGQQHGHKAVLEEDAVLNDAPLRARLKHVAARHGVVVHSGAVKACSLAVELYLRRVLQDMIRMHEIRTSQAKDVPGMVKDGSRNWGRNVAIIAEEEKEAQAQARHAKQLQEDKMTIANHHSRRRGEELDEEEKAKRKENVDAAKSRLGTAEAQNRVNENLKMLLPQRKFGQRRRLLGGKKTMLRADNMPNVMGPLSATPAAGTESKGPATPAGASLPGQSGTAATGDGAGVTLSRLGAATEVSKRAVKKTLTMQDMLGTLRHNPRYAHSQLHYKFLQLENSQPK